MSKLQDVLSLDIWNTRDPAEQKELGGLLPEGHRHRTLFGSEADIDTVESLIDAYNMQGQTK